MTFKGHNALYGMPTVRYCG